MITHDRWQRIKEIFQSAQERPPAERLDFLDKVCGDDKSIRDEVEALLTADESNDGDNFLSTPAFQFAAGMLSDEKVTSEFETGTKVGRYTILCPLGAGGMGQIYLAQDDQLGRKIALKLISREFATDPRRVIRFEQEARAASALNHPNVCVIHETGVTDNNRHFIAMEYIQGITLRDKLTRKSLAPLEAIQIARQVADALAAAHAARIVHRDIKPENIMLRPDGYVKVLDFGLAKLTEAVVPEPNPVGGLPRRTFAGARSESGTLMGTVKYMSPEQLREIELDERTDIWSLGVVLYEMLTGTTPFESRVPNGTIALIVGPQAPALSLPDHVPARFREIVHKAVAKDRDARYQTVTRLAADLHALQRELERDAEPDRVQPSIPWYPSEHKTQPLTSGSTIFTRIKTQALHTADIFFTEIRTHKTATIFAGATVVLAFVLSLPAIIQRFRGSVPQTSKPLMTPITNSGSSVWSAISPDGKLIVHAEEHNGKQRLMLTPISTYNTIEILAGDEVRYRGLTFSPDSQHVYFTREDEDGTRNVYRIGTSGGFATKVKDQVDSPVSFSPRGDQFAFVRFDQGRREYLLIVSDVSGANEMTIAVRKGKETLSTSGLAWSPDGRTIVCAGGRWGRGYQMDLLQFDIRNRAPNKIGEHSWFSIYQVAWKDETSLVISARESETAPHQLWRISYPTGEFQQITSDLNEYLGASVMNGVIVTVRQDRSWGLWVADLGDFIHAKSIIPGTGLGYGVTWTADGNIVYSSMVQDHLNLSRIAPDGSKNVPLTRLGENYNPAASADGRFVVFSSKQADGFNIFSMNPADGGNLKQLTFSDANFYPAVSPDNQWVAYDTLANPKASVWKVPAQGGTPVKVADGYRMPAFSPNGQWISVRYDEIGSGSGDLLIYPANGGEAVRTIKIPRLDWQRVYWIDNHTLSYVKSIEGSSNIWSYDLNTDVEKQLTFFNGEQIFSYAWSPDFKRVAAQRGGKISNVTVISSEQ